MWWRGGMFFISPLMFPSALPELPEQHEGPGHLPIYPQPPALLRPSHPFWKRGEEQWWRGLWPEPPIRRSQLGKSALSLWTLVSDTLQKHSQVKNVKNMVVCSCQSAGWSGSAGGDPHRSGVQRSRLFTTLSGKRCFLPFQMIFMTKICSSVNLLFLCIRAGCTLWNRWEDPTVPF